MNAVADHPLATGMRAETLNGLPDWVMELAQQCPDYRFVPCEVFRGRSVAAIRMTPGTGVYVVVTANEVEMRQALGFPARADAELCPRTALTRPTRGLEVERLVHKPFMFVVIVDIEPTQHM